MKNIINLIIALIAISSSFIIAANYKFYPLTMNISGFVQNENKILVYGDAEFFKYSSDYGETWSNIYIDSVLKVNKLIAFGDNIDGLADNNVYLNSDNFGKSFVKVKLDLSDSISVIDFTSNQTYIFLVTKSEVIQIEKSSLNKTIIPLPSSFPQNKVAIWENHLYIANNFDKILDYNLISNQFESPLEDSCENCIFASNLFVQDSLLYFSRVINSSDQMNSYEYNFKDKSTKLLSTSVSGLLVKQDSSYYSISSLVLNLPTIKELTFNFNSISQNGYNTISTYKDKFLNSYITQCKFINDNSILVVGANNTILLSTDKGKNWIAKSITSLQSHIIKIKNTSDSNLYINNAYHGIVTKSTNKGITWLTQKRNDSDLLTFPISSIITNDGFIQTIYKDSTIKSTNNNIDLFSRSKIDSNIDAKRYWFYNVSHSTKDYIGYSFIEDNYLLARNYICFFDYNNKLIKKIKLDSSEVRWMKIIDTSNIQLLISDKRGRRIDTIKQFLTVYDSAKTKLIETKDGGLTWKVLDVLDSSINSAYSEILSKDGNSKLFITDNLVFVDKDMNYYSNNSILKIENDKLSFVYSNFIKKNDLDISINSLVSYKNYYICSSNNYLLLLNNDFKVIDTIYNFRNM